jgi:hypothetical protein
LAVNCYVDPVYTLDADIVVIASRLSSLAAHLREQGFEVEPFAHSVNAKAPSSDLRIQFTTDERYQAFLARAVNSTVLGVPAKVACLSDVAQGKLWDWSDPAWRLSKRKKDELDLIRLAEAHSDLLPLYPEALRRQFGPA